MSARPGGYGRPMDRTSAQEWLDRYVAAWLSYDPDDIAALFSADVAYRYHPYDEPVVGRDAVVASWLGERGRRSVDADDPGTYGGVLRGGRRRGHRRGDRHLVLPGPGRGTGRADLRQLLRHALRRREAVRDFTEYYLRRP